MLTPNTYARKNTAEELFNDSKWTWLLHEVKPRVKNTLPYSKVKAALKQLTSEPRGTKTSPSTMTKIEKKIIFQGIVMILTLLWLLGSFQDKCFGLNPAWLPELASMPGFTRWKSSSSSDCFKLSADDLNTGPDFICLESAFLEFGRVFLPIANGVCFLVSVIVIKAVLFKPYFLLSDWYGFIEYNSLYVSAFNWFAVHLGWQKKSVWCLHQYFLRTNSFHSLFALGSLFSYSSRAHNTSVKRTYT